MYNLGAVGGKVELIIFEVRRSKFKVMLIAETRYGQKSLVKKSTFLEKSYWLKGLASRTI